MDMYNCEICGKPDSLDRGGVILCHNCDVRKNVGTARKEPQCTKCGKPANVAAFEDMYCVTCHNAKVQVDTLGDLLEDAKKVFGGIGEAIAGVFTPNVSSPIGPEFNTDHLVPPVGGTSIQEQYAKELYNRQPHYEGGIDPITYGKDNLSPEEMNGFYKMNVIKYVSRCDRKNGLEDLQKARDYLNLLIDSYEKTPVAKLTEEGKVIKEALLCYERVMSGSMALVKRKDVLEELQVMLQDVNYSISRCGDGETWVELA